MRIGINKKEKWKLHMSSAKLIPIGFLITIVLGTLLLLLPIATKAGEETDFLTALFTSTTSVCVTGLVVVDTYIHWSLFGQIVILCLIQIGGLGVVVIAALMMVRAGTKITIRDRVLIRDSFNLDSVGGTLKFLLRVEVGVLTVELIGAVLYAIRFVPEFGLVRGLWYGFFHSISAFCNAGIDIIGPNSLIPYQDDVLIMMTTMFLIIMGGLGYIVWFDVLDKLRFTKKRKRGPVFFVKHLREHTKLVISITLMLILAGAVITAVFEWNNPQTLGKMNTGGKLLGSLFQSVTLRTAGFAAVPQGGLKETTSFLSLAFMFIGGSPMGTAGGVKTVTMVIIILNMISYVKNRKEPVIFGRAIDMELIKKATSIVTISMAVTLALTVVLMATDGVALIDALYEIFSATATVGLTRGITGTLGSVGKVIVVAAMFTGRIGPISMAMFFQARNTDSDDVKYANGKFYVG